MSGGGGCLDLSENFFFCSKGAAGSQPRQILTIALQYLITEVFVMLM